MPSRQRGTVVRRGDRWLARWYDETGDRRARGGFRTRSEALDFLETVLPTVEALRRGDVAAVRRREMPTLGELAGELLSQHVAEDATVESLRFRLRYALEGPKLDGKAGWRDLRLDRLSPTEIGAWRKALPARSAFGIHKSLRQLLGYAVRVKLLDENPASLVPNPKPKRTEVQTLTLSELELIAAELPPVYRPIPVFVALTGLRPCEWIALQRADVDSAARVVAVRRSVVDGKVKPYGKTDRSLRTVGLPEKAAEALAAMPTRIDTRILFPASRGGHLALERWRWREWTPALRAAGVEHRAPNALRHTFASFQIAAGTSVYEIARLMGTSVAMIDQTYGHLLPDAPTRARTALDAFIKAQKDVAAGTR